MNQQQRAGAELLAGGSSKVRLVNWLGKAGRRSPGYQTVSVVDPERERVRWRQESNQEWLPAQRNKSRILKLETEIQMAGTRLNCVAECVIWRHGGVEAQYLKQR